MPHVYQLPNGLCFGCHTTGRDLENVSDKVDKLFVKAVIALMSKRTPRAGFQKPRAFFCLPGQIWPTAGPLYKTAWSTACYNEKRRRIPNEQLTRSDRPQIPLCKEY